MARLPAWGGHFENLRQVRCSNPDTLTDSGKTDSCQDEAERRGCYGDRLSLEMDRPSEAKAALWRCFLGRPIPAVIYELDSSTRDGMN
jgi:hypothetical protein